MSLGSKQTTQEVKLPPELEKAAIDNLNIANEVAAIPYVPYMGAEVAGFTPMQEAAMIGTNQAAQAFGMPHVAAPAGMSSATLMQHLTGNTGPKVNTGGVLGYSSGPAVTKLNEALSPIIKDLINSYTYNPKTGAAPTNPVVPQPKFTPPSASSAVKDAAKRALEEKKKKKAADEVSRRAQDTSSKRMTNRALAND